MREQRAEPQVHSLRPTDCTRVTALTVAVELDALLDELVAVRRARAARDQRLAVVVPANVRPGARMDANTRLRNVTIWDSNFDSGQVTSGRAQFY